MCVNRVTGFSTVALRFKLIYVNNTSNSLWFVFYSFEIGYDNILILIVGYYYLKTGGCKKHPEGEVCKCFSFFFYCF